MSVIKKHLLFLFICFYVGCSSNRPTVAQANVRTDSGATRLGTSEYYLRLPTSFLLSEARGKEGQLGYNIQPKDTSVKMFGFIEIRHGHPVLSSDMSWGTDIAKVQSSFLNRPVTWTVYRTETGVFEARTPNEKINAWVASDKRNSLDSLIAIVTTLTKQ